MESKRRGWQENLLISRIWEHLHVSPDEVATINTIYAGNWAALIVAAQFGMLDTVSLLLDRGADVNIVSARYGTALACAAHLGSLDIVLLLLDRGADVNIMDDYGTALAHAAHGGWLDIISLLLDRGADVNIVGGYYGTTLICALHGGSLNTVSLLLDRGADVNYIVGGDNDFGTALICAVDFRLLDIVSLLLDRGADVNIVGGCYGTALICAVHGGSLKMVSLLLDRGADVNYIVGGDNDYGTALICAVHFRSLDIVSLLLDRGADVNKVGGKYGTPLGTAAAIAHPDEFMVSFLLDRGADINIVAGDYGTALGAAQYKGNLGNMMVLLRRGARRDMNTVRCSYGTIMDIAIAAGQSNADNEQVEKYVLWLLEQGADINIVGGEYGTPLGKAAYEGNDKLVSFLLDHGADILHVGGKYPTANGQYPTALDAAEAGGAGKDLLKFLSDALQKHQRSNTDPTCTPWPPFPMPYTGSSLLRAVPREVHGDINFARCLESIQNPKLEGRASSRWLTSEQADLPCKEFDEAALIQTLITLVGMQPEAAHRQQSWIRNDSQYFISQCYDLGLAYAAVRIAWKEFNDPNFNCAVYRGRWHRKAREIQEDRNKAVYTDDMGKQVIKSPYLIMPRRMWDIRSNRVVDFVMLHSEFCARNGETNWERTPPPFWAITHSWTSRMETVKTSINQYEWPVPLPYNLNLESLRQEELVIKFGAKYAWLDVLCLRQQENPHENNYKGLNTLREEEWKLDVPTIGNIYRSAAALVRYFNGLGKPFSNVGWDDPRHWLQRAWTLQEIKNENVTFNGGISTVTSARIMMNTRVEGGEARNITVRNALRPVLKLAAEVDSSSGCSVYDLVREMAKRYATQPTDKVSGLLYLLRAITLPTYSEKISDEAAWVGCFSVLPFERKMEILFDFPYPACTTQGPTVERYWFPTWGQLMEWPERNPEYDHTLPTSLYIESGCPPKQLPGKFDQNSKSICIDNIWAISRVQLDAAGDVGEYEVGNATWGQSISFYSPYLSQQPIKTQRDQLFTIVNPQPQVSSNWVVCDWVETLQWEQGLRGGEVKVIEVEILRKVGVLRTDSCSVLFVGAGTQSNTMLKKINSLFI